MYTKIEYFTIWSWLTRIYCLIITYTFHTKIFVFENKNNNSQIMILSKTIIQYNLLIEVVKKTQGRDVKALKVRVL